VSHFQGAVWQRVRTRLLDSVPTTTRLHYASPQHLSSWRKEGVYVVAASTSKVVTVSVHPEDFAEILLGEAQSYLDHAAEHQALIWSQSNADAWPSPAWQVVTTYYWAYYLAMAATRVLGSGAWYLDGQSIAQFVALAPSGSRNPGGGTYRLRCDLPTTASSRTVEFRKRSGRLHEEVWRIWFTNVAEFVEGSNAGDLTERAFFAQKRASDTLGPDWPSDVRNLVNYRAGYAYDAVREKRFPGVGRIATANAFDLSDIVESFEMSVAGLRSGVALEKQIKPACRALFELTLLLHATCEALTEEIVNRTGVDKRWWNARKRFRRERGLVKQLGTWPC
jgi:hypothetical protein